MAGSECTLSRAPGEGANARCGEGALLGVGKGALLDVGKGALLGVGKGALLGVGKQSVMTVRVKSVESVESVECRVSMRREPPTGSYLQALPRTCTSAPVGMCNYSPTCKLFHAAS